MAARSSSTTTTPSRGTTTSKTSRRTSRFASPLLGVPRRIAGNRPPIIIEWNCNNCLTTTTAASAPGTSSFVRVGYAEQAQPQHILPLLVPSLTNDKEEEQRESQWYNNLVVPMIQQIYDRLMIDPTQRRVMVVVSNVYRPKAWEHAIKYALWNIGVPAITFINSLQVVPLTIGIQRSFIIHIDQEEAQCLIHVDGHSLLFTYQGKVKKIKKEKKKKCLIMILCTVFSCL